MFTINGKYKGDLRNELIHVKSSTQIQTDAPTDNNGKGESFSPTDLVAAALASCMLTIIGIRARTKNIEIGSPSYTVIKKMDSNPRKIREIEIEFTFNSPIELKDREYLEHEGRNCPVALSLHQDIVQNVKFIYA